MHMLVVVVVRWVAMKTCRRLFLRVKWFMTMFLAQFWAATLVNQVLFQLLRGMGSKSAGAVAKYSDVKEALIEGSIENIRIAQEEELFQAIILNETSTQMEHFLVQGNDAVRAEIVKIWAPVFERGRAEGTLRNDLSDERLAEIIHNVHSLVLMRKDETESAQRAFLEDLLWAALTNQSGS